MKNSIVSALIAALVAGIIAVIAVGMVGNNQPVSTIADLGATIGTRFIHGLATTYVGTPVTSNTTNSSVRRCQISSGSDACSVQNNSGTTWVVRPRIYLTGTASTTSMEITVSTSSSALSVIGAYPYGWATSTNATLAPIKHLFSTTTYGGLGTGRVLMASSTAASNNEGAFLVGNGDYIHCVVALSALASDPTNGYFEAATSSTFGVTTNCIYDVQTIGTPTDNNL